MKKMMVRFGMAMLTLVLMLSLMTACGNRSEIVIEDISTDPVSSEQSGEEASTDATKTAVTGIVAEGQMSLNDLMGLMNEPLTWDKIAGFDHTDVSDTEAEFLVADNEGRTCTMKVVYDPASGEISEANLISGDTVEDVLSGETAIIRRILVAMNQQQ